MSDIVTQPPQRPRIRFQGVGWRFASVAALTVIMFIPLVAVSLVIQDRGQYQSSAVREVSQLWGGPIALSGPFLILPVERERTRSIKGEDGIVRSETYVERAKPVVLMPEMLEIAASNTSDLRKRGIFEVPVFTSDIDIRFRFDTDRVAGDRVAGVLRPRETVLWDKAILSIYLPRTRTFSGHAVLKAGSRQVDLEPGTPVGHASGIQAAVGDPRNLGQMTLAMGLNGAGRIEFSPAGRETTVRMASDWPHPSFDGAFLPKQREISEAIWLACQIPIR